MLPLIASPLPKAETGSTPLCTAKIPSRSAPNVLWIAIDRGTLYAWALDTGQRLPGCPCSAIDSATLVKRAKVARWPMLFNKLRALQTNSNPSKLQFIPSLPRVLPFNRRNSLYSALNSLIQECRYHSSRRLDTQYTGTEPEASSKRRRHRTIAVPGAIPCLVSAVRQQWRH